MENFNTIPSQGAFGEVVASINNNFTLAKVVIEQIQYETEKNVGMYGSLSALQSAVTTPTNGMWGTVESSGTFTIYTYNGSSWVEGITYTPSAGTYQLITNEEMDSVLA